MYMSSTVSRDKELLVVQSTTLAYIEIFVIVANLLSVSQGHWLVYRLNALELQHTNDEVLVSM